KPEDRTRGEQTLVDIKRRLEDIKRDYRLKYTKKTEEQLTQLYREVNDAIRSHAAMGGFTVILAYGEPPDQDLLSFANISRKTNAIDLGAIVPIYVANGLDISQSVLDSLNRGLAPE